MLHLFLQYILLVIIILLLVMLAQKLKVAYPIVLVLGGLLLSLVPGIGGVSLNPELVFVIFLPPLLYEAAWYTSWKEFWRWRRVISSFAFLVVLFTSLVVAVVSSALLPGFSLALGFLLGGIVSPPDAVSASAIMKNVKAPKRVAAILEGESLLNDASSLVVFRFALIAIDTGRFVFHEAALSFVLVIAGGILIGLAVALLYYAVHKWLPTTPNMDIVLTLTAPYVMYIAAESVHVSGVLAVVSGGLFLSARSHLFLSNSSRLRGSNVWSALGFVLNGLVFMLIGLELPVITGQLGAVSMREAIWYGVLITLVLVVTRILCAVFASWFTVFISRYITTADSRPGMKGPLILGWAGMRGVVSLAAALSIPLYLDNGSPFPQRNLILFITFMVILLTLVGQGLTLPPLIRRINMPDPDNHLPDDEQYRHIRQHLADHSLRFLDELQQQKPHHNEQVQQLRVRFEKDLLQPDAESLAGLEHYQEVYRELLRRQRALLLELNKEHGTDEDILRKYHDLLDLEEEKLKMRFEQDA